MNKLFLIQADHWSTPGRQQKIVAHKAAADAAAFYFVDQLRLNYEQTIGNLSLEPVAEGDTWQAALRELARRLLEDRGELNAESIDDGDIETLMDERDDMPSVWIHEIDADLSPAPHPNPVAVICPQCGSDQIFSDAAASWSIELQDWELSSAHDSETCSACGYEGDGMGLRVPVDQVPPRPNDGEAREIGGRTRYWVDRYDAWLYQPEPVGGENG